jgi:hypothetical protein
VIALRWPKACFSCGIDMPDDADSKFAILGEFYVDKKKTKGDKRHTQVLLKVPGFFYRCDECTQRIERMVRDRSSTIEILNLLETLQESPWMVYIGLEKSGCIKVPEGPFKEKLQRANPDACIKKNDVLKVG